MNNAVIVILGKRGTGKTTLLKTKILPVLHRRIIYDTLGEYNETPDVVAFDIETLIDLIECNEQQIRFLSDNDNDFDRVCKLLYEPDETIGYSLVIDETDMFCSANNIPVYFKRLIRYGRHKQIGLFCVSRRPADLPKILTSQATHLITFAQHEPKDIEYISKIMPDADKLLSIPKYHFICYDTSSGSLSNNIVSI